MPDFTVKQGDLLPPVSLALFDPVTGLQVLPTAATFRLTRVSDGSVKVAAPASSINVNVVSYNWQGTDTDTQGTYYASFVCTVGGKQQTFPDRGPLTVLVTGGY